MHRYTRLLLTSLIAATALAAAISSASASRLSTSNKNITATWASLELSNTINREVVRCPVTLEGAFTESTIVKRAHGVIGLVNSANSGTCTGGTTTIHRETLPWRLTYESFAGTLPRITSIRLLLIRATFEIRTSIATCSAETTSERAANGIANLNESTGEVTGLEAERTARIPLRGGLCALGEGSFAGNASVTLTGTSNKITITLI